MPAAGTDLKPKESIPIILASGSPRRRMLLQEAGITFDVCVPDESAEQGIVIDDPAQLVETLALRKCQSVAQQVDWGIVLAADTVAEIGGAILGKPRDRAHARAMLTQLQGTSHRVWTGVCLCRRPGNDFHTKVLATQLNMARLDERAIESYLDSDLWRGKAGAFGYQDGNDWVQVVSGSESNVVGLPMEYVIPALHQLKKDRGA